MKKLLNHVFVVIILVALLFLLTGCGKEKVEDIVLETEQGQVEEKTEGKELEIKEEAKAPEFEIFNGNDRPIAFMIDNNKNAQPQASLNSTYLVYEIIVEGGESRLMALFKGKVADEVGPIRSARHYFIDYAMENDALYAHLGMSPQAQATFQEFGIQHINGQVYDTGKARTDTSLYWRAKHKKAPHNAYTNTESILEVAKGYGWKTTSDKKPVLNYVTEEVELNSEDAFAVQSVKIPYTKSHVVEYKYNSETGRYTRWSKGKKMFDEMTSEEVTTKNLIITLAENYTLDDGEDKGRQDVLTIGSLDGYYITNGKAIKIKCNKASRFEQTKYVDLNGNEIKVNDGNTWINVCPIDAELTFIGE